MINNILYLYAKWNDKITYYTYMPNVYVITIKVIEKSIFGVNYQYTNNNSYNERMSTNCVI